MKRFWHRWLALVAITTMAGTANAQWNQPSSEIGSYQSILARAGYSQSPQDAPGSLPSMNNLPTQPGPVAGGYTVGSPAPMQSVTQGGSVDGCNPGCTPGSAMVGGTVGCAPGAGMATYADYGAAAGAAGCGPVYSPGAQVGLGSGFANRIGLGGGGNVNRVGSIFGVVFRRDYEDEVRLANNGTDMIYSTDVDQGTMSGLGVSLITRSCNGNGWEAVYWGLDDDQDISLAGPTMTDIAGFADLDHVPSGYDVQQIYDAGTDARFYRDTEINNFELNLLRNGGRYTTRRGWCGTYELLGGFRLFQFDESFRYVSNTNAAGFPMTMDYLNRVENLLLGLQVGARNEVCVSDRLRLSGGATAGLFNNRVDMCQGIFDETGYSPLLGSGPSAGRPYDYMDQKDDVAFLGQFDVGLIYQLSSKMRARIGYRAMGVSGVALAVDQIPYDFTDAYMLQRVNTNGSLLMHGLYFGSEFCF